MPSALLLGSGFVATPTVEILSNAGVKVTVACRTLAKASAMSASFENATPFALDVNNTPALEAAVAAHDVVISLIPYTYHAAVIKAAIKAKKHVVTTSYVSPAMKELDAAAKEAGITVMNEIGLDPGIDHLYAVKTIHEVHAAGGKITSFISMCGGLPAPECSDNPLGYKFSWSSRGVLLALKNSARFWQDGKVVDVASADLMGTAKPFHTGFQGYSFVCYPNRDSTPYKELYGIPECQTVIRGTLRYAGFPEFVKVLVDVGFLADDERDFLKDASPLSWREATSKVLGTAGTSEEELIAAIESKATFQDSAEKDRIVAGLRWIGLFSDTPVQKRGTPLDTLCAELEAKMAYGPGERDLVMLQHRFDIEHADGRKETRTSTLCANGEPTGYSAMAKTVGVPCGVATLMVLDGRISRRGVLAPHDMELAGPIMDELREKYDIQLIEKTI
ncbi:saccharopine dehydrogenase-like protein [Trichodelitschia bisporula]|uniref:Saccharopine dehydrogenase [NADP(+), L-glutamate-forming] n=1 Tax=Trichodelitschia bisporula TaxID=703511 RepID=A0A6G1I505_9PEZI|nr:saccharopine dehydrogenase-like protein [Trichodelitschia bisporula]